MPMRDRVRWAFAILFSMALLSAPAIWNRIPLLQYDTGGYLARWYEPYLVPSRAVAYGLVLNAGAALSFWPVVLAQSALTVWVIALLLRAHGFGRRPGLLGGTIAALSVFSTLPCLPRFCSPTFSPGSRSSPSIFSCFARTTLRAVNKSVLLS